MKIIRLSASNILKLSAVDITPDGNTVVISGKNAAGKSSVLHAMWLALGGGQAQKAIPEPLHQGKKKGEVELDLGDMTVKRTFTQGKATRLEVKKKDGAAYSSPQKMLDGLVGRLSFDPLEFAQMKPRDQRETLLEMVDVDLESYERQRKSYYDQRTEVNREVKRLEGALDSFTPSTFADAPSEEISAKELLDEHGKAVAERRQAEQRDKRKEEIAARQGAIEEQIADLEREHDSLCSEAESLVHLGPWKYRDPDKISEALATIESTNDAVRMRQQYERTKQELESAADQSHKYTEEIESLDDQRRQELEQAELPVEGLDIDEEQVLYHGVPFSQASSAEQLRVSLAMAMALNPELRVVRITDGSLLDDDSMRAIQRMAEDHDYQVWVEVVDSSGELGIYIEDGQVVAAEAGRQV